MGVSYPNTFIRGIQNESFLEDAYPAATLFNKFDSNDDRADDLLELSINWNDDENAIVKIFEQKKKDTEEFQFKAGGAILSTNELTKLCMRPPVKGFLSFERKPIENNDYHGNLLIKNNTSKAKKNLIAAGLVLCISDVLRRP